jgi:hypothetical protein
LRCLVRDPGLSRIFARLGDPAFRYDGEKDLFSWTDGRFAFSREHADREFLKKRGRLRET